MYIVKTRGNGSCLYIALRLGLEYQKILSDGLTYGIIDGNHPIVLDASERLRSVIVRWFTSNPEKLVQLEEPIKRIDIVKKHTDMSAEEYLEKQSKFGQWAGVPEYIAFAFMAQMVVEVYCMGSIIDCVRPPNSKATIKLAYLNNHYELLLDDAEADGLKKLLPAAKITYNS